MDIHGYPWMDIHGWISIHGYASMEYPSMDILAWISVNRHDTTRPTRPTRHHTTPHDRHDIGDLLNPGGVCCKRLSPDASAFQVANGRCQLTRAARWASTFWPLQQKTTLRTASTRHHEIALAAEEFIQRFMDYNTPQRLIRLLREQKDTPKGKGGWES